MAVGSQDGVCCLQCQRAAQVPMVSTLQTSVVTIKGHSHQAWETGKRQCYN
jgi:hypothetical protein